MKIYIAGSIAGDKRYKAKFQEAAQKLTEAGHIALNPATQPAGLSRADYMRVCFAMMEAADVALFLPGYRESQGAMLEWTWCRYVGKRICYDMDCFGGKAIDCFGGDAV